MSNNRNKSALQNVTINVNDIRQYVNNTNSKTSIAGFMSLRSYICMTGLKQLYNDLHYNKLEDENIEQIRQRYAHALLNDIEEGQKLPEVIRDSAGNELSFKSNFYDEVLKLPQHRLQEYTDFINTWSKLSDSLPIPYKLSAKALLALDKKLSSSELKEELIEILEQDKMLFAEQSKLDFHRSVIGYRGKDNIAKQISLDELKNSQDIDLTNEQREFIASYWHQGTFMSGAMYMYLNNSFMQKNNLLQSETLALMNDSSHSIPIFIDALDGNTKVYNVIDTYLGQEDLSRTPWVKAAVIADISHMQGNKFVPCCSEMPSILLHMNKLPNDKDINAFDIPQELNVSFAPVDDKFLEIDDLFTKACLNSVCSLGNSGVQTDHARGKAWSALSKMQGVDRALEMIVKGLYAKDTDDRVKIQSIHNVISNILKTINKSGNSGKEAKLEDYNTKISILKKSMVQFCQMEQNKEFRNQFTDNILSLFVNHLPSNNEYGIGMNEVKKDIIEILTPLCSNNREIKALNKGINKAIGGPDKQVQFSKSIKQIWKTLKSKILKVVDSILGINNAYEKIITQYPAMMQQIQNNICIHLKNGQEYSMQGKEVPIKKNKKQQKLGK